MVIHAEFLSSPHSILDPEIRRFRADEALGIRKGNEYEVVILHPAVISMSYM